MSWNKPPADDREIMLASGARHNSLVTPPIGFERVVKGVGVDGVSAPRKYLQASLSSKGKENEDELRDLKFVKELTELKHAETVSSSQKNLGPVPTDSGGRFEQELIFNVRLPSRDHVNAPRQAVESESVIFKVAGEREDRDNSESFRGTLTKSVIERVSCSTAGKFRAQSMTEIAEEAEESTAEPVEQQKIAVALGKSQTSHYSLKWALDNVVSRGQSVHLLHVQAPLRLIPTPMGNKLPVEQISEDIVNNFKMQRFRETETLLNQYRKMCEKRQVKPEVCYFENDVVQDELVDQISKLNIEKLVLGTSSHNRITKALRGSGISSYVAKHSPDFCTVMVIYKGKLHSVKDARKPLSSHSLTRGISTSSTSESTMSKCDINEEVWNTQMHSIQTRDNSCDSTISYRGLANQNTDSTPPTRLFKNMSADFSCTDNSAFHSPQAVNISYPPGGRIFQSAPATPLIHPMDRQSIIEHPSTWSLNSNDNFESRASLVHSQHVVDKTSGNIVQVPEQWEEIAAPATPSASYLSDAFVNDTDSIFSSYNNDMCGSEVTSVTDIDALSEIGFERRDSDTPNMNEEPTLQRYSPEPSLALSTSEVITVEELSRQLEQAKLSADWAQKEAVIQANRCREAEDFVARAMKMVRESDAQRKEEICVRDDALRDAQVARQQVLRELRRCEEALSALAEAREMVKVALKDKEIFRQKAEEETRKRQEVLAALEDSRRTVKATMRDTDVAMQHAETESRRYREAVASLEELTKTLELEVRLRKEAEEAAMRDKEVAVQHAKAEIRRYHEAVASLEELKKMLELEVRLRKEAEEKVLQEAIAKQEVLAALRKAQQRYTEYSYEELQEATSDFQEELKLGEGGYGSVYKGKIHHTTVAIKVLKRDGLEGREEFQREVEVLSGIHHPHMVMLLGACSQKGCIVYEYMANGSLEDRLNCKDGTAPLPWYVRFRICSEVATALLFLHSRPEPIVHRDLKPGNILLDHNFVSKVSDVGLARLVPNNLTFSLTMYRETVPVGTFAYIDPDYQRTGVVSRHSDVYALGIVMLQLLTGKPALGVTDMVEEAVDTGRFDEVLDKSAGDWPLEAAMELACLSLQCAEPRRKHRPDLETKVISVLENIRTLADDAAAREAASISLSCSSGEPIIPSFFLCPISQEIMEDPHIAADGFTYDNDVINAWLQSHDTSPMTNLKLNHKNLIPNYSIRSAIREWLDKDRNSR